MVVADDDVIKSMETLLEVTIEPEFRKEIEQEIDKLKKEQSDQVFDSTIFPTTSKE